MDNLSEGSSAMNLNISAPRIRILESNLAERIKDLDNEIIEGNIFEVTTVCDDVKDKILNHEDEVQLSKVYNNYRRIHIASELLFSICSLHDRVVDIEFTKTVNDLLEIEKFRSISRRILRKRHLELKKEKYFAKEADTKLPPLEDNGHATEEARPEESHAVSEEIQAEEQAPQQQDLNISPSDRPNQSVGDTTEIRGEITTEMPNLQDHTLNINTLRENVSLPCAHSDILVRESNIEYQVEQDLNEILQILEDQITESNIARVNQPQNLSEVRDFIVNIPEPENGVSAEVSGDSQVNGETEISDELKLSSLESVEIVRRKRGRVIMDEKTYISNYAARALQLNRNIAVERVQVFQGPPNVLQSVSVEYLMKRPGFGNTIFHNKRNGRLNALYNRHLILEKKPIEPTNGFLRRSTVERHRVAGPTSLPRIIDTTEERSVRVGMRSIHEKRGILSEVPLEINQNGIPMEKKQPEIPKEINPPDIPPVVNQINRVESTINETVQNLNGIPMSRLMPPPVEASVLENIIGVVQKSPSPRLQQLQGSRPDPKKSPPWFLSSRKNPPNPKWRKFSYVLGKLEQLWTLLDEQGIEKSIGIHEFLALDQNHNAADYLILLRVFDKLSLQRKLILEYTKEGIFIKPFEAPFVSSKQLLLYQKDPVF